jgi:IS605 OrfB family transposase
MPQSVTRTWRLKVRKESYSWLNAAATEVTQVFNFCNEASFDAARRTDRKRKWLTGFDLCNLTAGATKYFEHIGAHTIQRVCAEYAQKRLTARRMKLKWRVSSGSRRSLGWIPFKAGSLKRKGRSVRFCGKTFRLFEAERLNGVSWKQGCFAQDALGDWWLCLPVEVTAEESLAPREAVGIDLGLKDVAVTSEGDRLQAGTFYRNLEQSIARAQRRGHKRQAKRLHRKAARCRADALHKFSRCLVDQYQNIFVGDVSSPKLARTRMAKSVLDSGWGMLRTFLQYKGEHAGRTVCIVNERNTTRACSGCGALTGPTGPDRLVVRRWICAACGEAHDRDVNAARNILTVGLRGRASMRGNEPSDCASPSSQCIPLREAGSCGRKTAA